MSWQGEVFKGKIGFTMEDSTPHWNLPPRPAAGSPNVLMIVLDDVGYAHLGCYGSPIETPNIDALAANGLRYSNWHATALCSPTRSCLLTGRNNHTNGMGIISELAQGYPGYDGVPKPSRGYISEILHEQGFATYALGKWHQVPAEEMTMAGPFDRWPLGRGFDRFYGFLGAETDQYHPDLVYDNHYVEPPAEEGYHLTADLADQAIAFLRDLRSADPTKPFFMYFCTGAQHAPHQVPSEWTAKYSGKFDAGWDAYREAAHQRQLELGLIPPGTELSPRHEMVKAWEAMSADEQRLYARMMEVFAGFLTHTDYHIGRLIQALKALGDLDNTLIMLVSDNGASGEGGFFGSFNENLIFNGVPDTLEQNLRHYDDLGSEKTYNHYPTGWTNAGNTPFKRWKRNVHNGGVADPCIVSWPQGIAARGEIRHQYMHAIDVMPTLLGCARRRTAAHVTRRAAGRDRRRQFQSNLHRAASAGNPHPAILRMLRLPRDLLRWLESRHVPYHPRHPGRWRRRSVRAVHAGSVGAVPRGRGLRGVSRSGRAGAGAPAEDDRAMVR